ncbi:gdp-fucose protein o-fucosyltransferase [Cystoisospora suis]|uniref:GDP-fucose protein O-fucosyltransferase 2 n=1 Tax=Cystoisospora suis TaxID=483139 RepID=A0A2C6KJ03_9APIC|nr:gdp-fucose protein o-fucosyltransferase [Cystoisospora suis]
MSFVIISLPFSMGLSSFPSLSPSPSFLLFTSSLLLFRLSPLLIVSFLSLSPSSLPLSFSDDSAASVSRSPSFPFFSSLHPSSSSSSSFSSLSSLSFLSFLCQSVRPLFPFAWSSHSSPFPGLFSSGGIISAEAHSDYLPQEKNDGVCPSYMAINRYLASFYGVPSFTCSRQGKVEDHSSFGQNDEDILSAQHHASPQSIRFVLYDVKNGEGFHLQKEVIYRTALMIDLLNNRSILERREKNLNENGTSSNRSTLVSTSPPSSSLSFIFPSSSSSSFLRYPSPLWVLVLPPWCRLSHWSFSPEADAIPELKKLPWGAFYDLNVLRERLPVLEFHEFLAFQQFPYPKTARRRGTSGETTYDGTPKQEERAEVDVVFTLSFSSSPAAKSRPFCYCPSTSSSFSGELVSHRFVQESERDSEEKKRQDRLKEEDQEEEEGCCRINDLTPSRCMRILDSCHPLERKRLLSFQGERESNEVAKDWSSLTAWLGGFCSPIKASEFWCAEVYLSDAQRAADFLWRSLKERPPDAVQTLWFKYAESLLVPWPEELLKEGLIDMLYIHPRLRCIGELFIEVFLSPPTETGDTKEERNSSIPRRKLPYISAHLRRTDFVYLNRAVPINHAANKLVDLMKEQNVPRAFICTDGTSEEKEELKREVSRLSSSTLQVVYFSPSFLSDLVSSTSSAAPLCSDGNMTKDDLLGWRPVIDSNKKACTSFGNKNLLRDDIRILLLHPGIAALIETWIASRASYFIGTPNSRFSQAIRWERILSGFSHTTTLETFCLNGAGAAEGTEKQKEAHGNGETKKCFAVKSHDPPEIVSRSEVRKLYWP